MLRETLAPQEKKVVSYDTGIFSLLRRASFNSKVDAGIIRQLN